MNLQICITGKLDHKLTPAILRAIAIAIESGDSTFGGTDMGSVNVLSRVSTDSGMSCGNIENRDGVVVGSWDLLPLLTNNGE
jgi:hypothetical protein